MRAKFIVPLFVSTFFPLAGCASTGGGAVQNINTFDMSAVEVSETQTRYSEIDHPTELSPTLMPLQLITQTPSVQPDSSDESSESINNVHIDEQKAEAMKVTVRELYEKGLLDGYQGSYAALEDFDEVWAQRGWFQWWTTDYNPKNFVLRGNAAWDSDESDPRPESAYSGCGIVFRATSEASFYVIYLGLDGRAHLHVFNENGVEKMGSMADERFGDNGLSGNAQFMLVVEDDWFTFYVDNKRIIQTSAQTHEEGGLALTLLSGTNRGYGTHCRMTDLELWALDDDVESESANDLPYKQDFENGEPAEWQVYAGGWQVQQEEDNHYWLAHYRFDADNQAYLQSWLDPGDSHWKDFSFESRVRFDTDGTLFICARTSPDGESFYSAYLDSQNNYVSIIDYDRNAVEGEDFQVFGETGHELDTGVWYTVRLEVFGRYIRFYIDNELVSTAERNSWSEGGVGFYMDPANQVSFDDIQIWSLEP